jgi:hypothetical protein
MPGLFGVGKYLAVTVAAVVLKLRDDRVGGVAALFKASQRKA